MTLHVSAFLLVPMKKIEIATIATKVSDKDMKSFFKVHDSLIFRTFVLVN